MFRGGRVNSRGMGITSGLDRTGYSSGGSTGLSPSTTTGSQILNQALGQPGTLIGDTNRLLGNLRQGIFNTITRPLGNIPIAASNYAFGTDLDYIQPMDYQQDILNLMENVRVGKTAKSPKSKIGSAQASEIGLDDDEDTDDATVSEMIAEGTDKKTPVQKATEPSGPSTNTEDIDKDEVSLSDVEKAKKEYAELLGIEKARGRDISDMLGRFSAAALRAPSLRDAFADYMALETQAGPGRAEKIQQAAGTLAAKEAISGKQLDKRIEAAKAGKLFAPGNIEKNVAYLTRIGKSRDEAVAIATKQPTSFAEALTAYTDGDVILPAGFKIAAEAYFRDDYKGDQQTTGVMDVGETVALGDGVYTDAANRLLFEVKAGKVTSSRSYK
jgi:hypothetical protein